MSEALKSVEAELLAVTQQREALAAQMDALQRRGAAADAAKEQQHAKQLEALTEQIRALKKKHGAQGAQLRTRQAVERRVGELQAGRTHPCSHRPPPPLTALHRPAPPCTALHRPAPPCTAYLPAAIHHLHPLGIPATHPLQAEVDGIKAHKVALARKMREAQDSHRAQRLEREREIKALRRKVR